MQPLPPPRYPCHGRQLTPVQARALVPSIESASLVGDPHECLTSLAAQLAAQDTVPVRHWTSWSAVGDLAAVCAACDGRRLLWTPEADGDPFRQWRLLQAIGRHSLPVTLIAADPGAQLTWGDWAALPGWRVAAPNHAAECRAVLRRTLLEEWPTLIVLPRQWYELGGSAFFGWGDARPSGGDAEVWLVAASDAIGIALEARVQLSALGIGAAVVPCTSLSPLPETVVRLREHRLVVVIDSRRSWAGLGGLWQRVQPAVDCSYCGAETILGAAPLPSDVVATVRIQLGF
ncbi:MAG: hypothetical protein ACOCXJ_00870 [Planctomycetota bacterium]